MRKLAVLCLLMGGLMIGIIGCPAKSPTGNNPTNTPTTVANTPTNTATNTAAATNSPTSVSPIHCTTTPTPVIDTFEQDSAGGTGYSALPTNSCRSGGWFVYGTGAAMTIFSSAGTGCGGDNNYIEFSTTNPNTTYAGFGMNILNTSGNAYPYDASAYSGVSFCLQLATAYSNAVTFPNSAVLEARFPDQCTVALGSGVVGSWYMTLSAAVTGSWTSYGVAFSGLSAPTYGSANCPTFTASQLCQIQWALHTGANTAPFDVYLDNLTFY